MTPEISDSHRSSEPGTTPILLSELTTRLGAHVLLESASSPLLTWCRKVNRELITTASASSSVLPKNVLSPETRAPAYGFGWGESSRLSSSLPALGEARRAAVQKQEVSLLETSTPDHKIILQKTVLTDDAWAPLTSATPTVLATFSSLQAVWDVVHLDSTKHPELLDLFEHISQRIVAPKT